MNLTKEEQEYIESHLRRPDNDLAIAKIAGQIAEEFKKAGGNIDAEEVKITAYIMNIGESDKRISHIYDPNYSWKEHPEAIELNKLHGKYSVEMAESCGIKLTEEQKKIIEEHSKQEYNMPSAQIIKAAEICRATEGERYYRGEKKMPAENWEEVKHTLKENNIGINIIELARIGYGKKQFPQKKLKKEELMNK